MVNRITMVTKLTLFVAVSILYIKKYANYFHLLFSIFNLINKISSIYIFITDHDPLANIDYEKIFLQDIVAFASELQHKP